MRKFLLLLPSICFYTFVEAQQTINEPAVAEQSHQDLNITQIDLYKDSTVIYLSVENKMAQGGWFCADKNIYIENPKNHKRLNIIKAKGIPTCPSVHNFIRIGEKLNFSLVFPEIPVETKLLNLVEDCDKSCFKFSGIILDEKLNLDIKLYNHGVELYAANSTKEAIDCFTKVVEVIPEFPTHVYGYSYFNLIRIYADKGDKETALFWFDQLQKSTLADKQYFIDTLRKEGVIGK
jgi:tetratricopeptide (TPR) repeat protein